MSPTRSRRWLGIAAFLIVLHTLLAYGLPVGAFVLIALALGFLFYRVGPLGALTVALGFVAATLLYALVIRLGGLENAMYYRPHERLVAYDYEHRHRSYRRNAVVEMRMPHGDLQSMTGEDIAQPRDVVFRTDDHGFRNDVGYRGQRYVLVGDSFIAAVGDTQANMLNAQLERDYGIDSYNLGHPGNLTDYIAYIEGFRARYGQDFKVLLFLFEGNDFPDALPEIANKRYSRFSLFWKRYYNMFSDTNVFRLTKSLVKRATRLRSIAGSENVRTYDVHGQRLGFYVPYIAATTRAEYRPGPEVERAILAIGPQLEHVFFIPTNYRVYHRHIAPGEALPHAHWEYLSALCRRHQLRCTDLTPALVAASDRLLRAGRFSWWQDDTHWNADGMAAAARVVAEVLRPPPR